MAWSIKTNDLASIHSFEQAEKHWNESVAWKNGHTSWRPLAGRRKTHMHMVKLSQGGYECVLFSMPIVTYYPDGSVKLATYSSQSTQLFAHDMKPAGCTPVSHKRYMYWCVETPTGPHYQRETMVITPERCGVWTVTNPAEPEKEFVLDRKKATEVRKILKPYKQWAEMTRRLSGNHGATVYDFRPFIKALLERPEEVEKFPTIFKAIGTPDRFMYTAYELAGARSKQPVPRTRLPKEMTL